MTARRISLIYATVATSLALTGCASPTGPTGSEFGFIATTPNPLTTDARYDAAFYRLFALGGNGTLNRQTAPPAIWVNTTDDQGVEIDRALLVQTGAAALGAATMLTGEMGTAGLSFGSPISTKGAIVIKWASALRPDGACGVAPLAGSTVTLHYQQHGWCDCAGSGRQAPLIVKHEIGHALGYYHTDQITDLMHPGGQGQCDMDPSPREIFHAKVAYSQAIGSGVPR